MDIIRNHPVTNVEILQLIPNCKFFLYSDLWKVKSLNELLPRSIILYQLAKVGHWVCIFENKEGINVFDSLGYAPDDELDLIEDRLRLIKYHEDYTYLLKLLSQTDKEIIYNDHRLQAKSTSTCGMWVTHRLMHSDMTEDEYYDMMKKIKNKDLYIAKYWKFLKSQHNL